MEYLLDKLFAWRWRRKMREAAKPVKVPNIDPEILRLGDELVRTKMQLIQEQSETRALRERVSYLENRLQDRGPGGPPPIPAATPMPGPGKVHA